MRVKPILFAGLCVFAVPVAAQSPEIVADAVEPATDRYSQAYELARILRSETWYRTLVAGPAYSAAIRESIVANPDSAALESEFPGITSYMVQQMLPAMIRVSVDELPSLWGEIAPIIAANMTAPEIQQSIEFYSSPAMLRFAEMSAENLNAEEMRRLINDGNNISGEQLQAFSEAIALDTLERTGSATRVLIALYGRSEAGRKFVSLMPTILETEAEWTNRPIPEWEEEFAEIAEEAALEFMIVNAGAPEAEAEE